MSKLYRYTVWSPDVWGNENDGFEINDRCKVGTIEIGSEIIEAQFSVADKGIMQVLEASRYLKKGAHKKGKVTGDYSLMIEDATTSYPWLQLELEEVIDVATNANTKEGTP